MRAYFNYPKEEIILHNNAQCPGIQAAGSSHTRQIDLSPANFSQAIQRFISGQVPFSEAQFGTSQNDLWLNVQFNDPQFELAVTGYIRRLLSQFYPHFLSCSLTVHCWPLPPGHDLVTF